MSTLEVTSPQSGSRAEGPTVKGQTVLSGACVCIGGRTRTHTRTYTHERFRALRDSVKMSRGGDLFIQTAESAPIFPALHYILLIFARACCSLISFHCLCAHSPTHTCVCPSLNQVAIPTSNGEYFTRLRAADLVYVSNLFMCALCSHVRTEEHLLVCVCVCV